ncbi:MAG: hypothetical protein IE933_00225 [Sphingomonadales bacterium]|nr:hypothetical protein [Sphingomonadales bacterium]MBD3772751.1 hypothetical protein [Paracoccaceae bacterium]
MSAIRLPRLALMLLLATTAAAATATPGGRLGTLPLGNYACTLPGDAAGLAVVPVTEADFSIIFGSSYANGAGKGTYLLTGKTVQFTSGPMKGMVFAKTGSNTIREQAVDGSLSEKRCTRIGSAN